MWTTLSLPGNKLTRDPDTLKKLLNGSRDLHIPPWKDSKNMSSSAILPQDRVTLIHTGRSQLLVLDFDTDLFTQAQAVNLSLPATQQCTLVSENIGKPGGHFFYRYSDNPVTNMIGDNGAKKYGLDLLCGNHLVFATTIPNETKRPLSSVQTTDELIHIPEQMQSIVMGHYARNGHKTSVTGETETRTNYSSSKLGRVAREATESPAGLLRLLNIITTSKWGDILAGQTSDLPSNHPDRLPATESGHMYLVSIGNVLRLDPSVDAETYMELLFLINDLFSDPIPIDEVGDICEHDKKRFVYNEGWDTDMLTLVTHDDELLEVYKYVDGKTIDYLVHNSTTEETIELKTAGEVTTMLASSVAEPIKKAKLDASTGMVRIIDEPSQPFGHNFADRTFNRYRWNESQTVFYQPEPYSKLYRRPDTTLRALEAAIGSQLYTHFLPFLRRKLMTWAHSPLFFVLYGVPHSFKSGLFNGVLGPLTPRRHMAINEETGTEKYNNWMVGKDFVFLDEAHHILHQDLRKLIKVFNSTGGSDKLTGIRAMHKSASVEEYPNELTFIIATNENIKLTTEIGERRMVVFSSNTSLTDALDMPDEEIRKRIVAEKLDFAYYLSTEVRNISLSEYGHNRSWKNEAYADMQETVQSPMKKLVELIGNEDYEGFEELILLDFPGIQLSNYTNNGHLRLFNNRDDVASQPGLFNKILKDSEHRDMRREMSRVPSSVACSYKTRDGDTGNRKIDWTVGTEINVIK